jgi:hypothetical protein
MAGLTWETSNLSPKTFRVDDREEALRLQREGHAVRFRTMRQPWGKVEYAIVNRRTDLPDPRPLSARLREWHETYAQRRRDAVPPTLR